ncbi:MAG: glutamate-1-semialdehyde 2,1-aminomutase [Myxococcota bacterium]
MIPERSSELLKRGQAVIPGGVNSPVRAFKSVGGTPRFISRGQGCSIWDADGHEYIDYVGSWGPMILGHAAPSVVQAIQEAAHRSSSFGAPTEGEVELAEHVVRRVPSVERLRLTSSGTEAAMSAIRLARAATGRDKILKFEGCYHGHADYLLVQAGSGVATLGLPDSPGVPAAFAQHTLTAPFNDLEAVQRAFEAFPEDIACVAVEPITGNMGVIQPDPGFLEGLRDLTRAHGALLLFDEVMTGFRVHRRCAQALLGVEPDLTAFGKVIGGGMPLAGFGGPARVMDLLAPVGPVYQAGTLSGNPCAVAAGLETLRALDDEAPYAQLERQGARLQEGLQRALRESGVPGCVQRVGSMLTLFFNEGRPVRSFSDAKACDHERFSRFFHLMLERGVYLPPSGFEAMFMSLAHSEDVVDQTIEAARAALKAMA